MVLLIYVTSFFLISLAILAFYQTATPSHTVATSGFSIGTPVVYRQDEVSANPALNARDIHPAERGEYYYYSILHYLRVIEVLNDGRVIAVARNHERLCFWPNDSGLRKARLTERLFHPLRFPHS